MRGETWMFFTRSEEKLSRASTWLPSFARSDGPRSSDYSSHSTPPRSSARPCSMTNWRRSDCWCYYCCFGDCCTCHWPRLVRGLMLEWWRMMTSASRRRTMWLELERRESWMSYACKCNRERDEIIRVSRSGDPVDWPFRDYERADRAAYHMKMNVLEPIVRPPSINIYILAISLLHLCFSFVGGKNSCKNILINYLQTKKVFLKNEISARDKKCNRKCSLMGNEQIR